MRVAHLSTPQREETVQDLPAKGHAKGGVQEVVESWDVGSTRHGVPRHPGVVVDEAHLRDRERFSTKRMKGTKQ